MNANMDMEAQEAGLRSRLAELTDQHSLSEIARRTNTPRSSLGHYLNGRKIPAAFCSVLIDVFNLNPAWLLNGKGSMQQTQIEGSTAHLASEMLSLVDAMNASLNMRLGAIQGDNQLKTLRALKQQLQQHETLLKHIEKQIVPVFSYFVSQLDDAIDGSNLRAAARALDALDDIAELCRDEDLRLRYRTLKSVYLGMTGELTRAVPIIRELFLSLFISRDRNDLRFNVQANNLIFALTVSGQFEEARRICNMVLPYVEQEAGLHARFLGFHAFLDAQNGKLKRAQRYIQRAFSVIPPDSNKLEAMFPSFVYFFSGSHDLGSLRRAGSNSRDKLHFLVRAACLSENQEELSNLLKEYATEIKDTFALRHAKALVDILKSKKPSAPTSFDDLAPFVSDDDDASLNHFARLAVRAQLFRLCGKASEAQKLVLEADLVLSKVEQGTAPPLIYLALHHRNALELGTRSGKSKGQQQLRDIQSKAQRFFKRYIKRGYTLFRSFIDE